MKKKKIKFDIVDEISYALPPSPSKKYLPKWYRDLKPYTEGEITLKSQGGSFSNKAQKTAKMCVPFMDTLTSGYIFETWCDIEIEKFVVDGKDHFKIYWLDDQWSFLSERPQTAGLVVPEGYHQDKLSFHTPFFIKTPPGYSIMISQPYNRYDTPFLALTGIVDTDIYPMFPGNFPLYVKKGFYGIIPKGTPLLQIMPFKRDSWKAEYGNGLAKEGLIAKKLGLSVIANWYRSNAWAKKSYE